jgi:hypothetical protein
MYIMLEYLAYVTLVAVLGAVLFGASTTVLIAREGARRAAQISRQLAHRRGQFLSKYFAAPSTLPRQDSPETRQISA